MFGPKLQIAFWNYDRCKLLRDGTVKIDGVNAEFPSGRIVTDIFEAMISKHAYDISELGMTYFLRDFDTSGGQFLLIPVFLVRSFRHSAIYINKHKGISGPADLVGKRIGELGLYGHDAGVMPKGILSDDFGFRAERNRWIIGSIDFPLAPVNFVSHPVPKNVEVEWCGKETDLGEMLERGEIDALISADIPKCVLQKSPNVGRLFEDYQAVEREYYRRTGIFPIMHAVAVKRELAEMQPKTVRAVYDAFCAAKDQMAEQYVKGMTFNNMAVMLPWLTKLIGEDQETLGKDWWPYGIKANRPALEAVLRYHHEQGLTSRRYALEDVFVPALLET
jgi:4,5-dihydroxyphthalate decarboxylase